MPLSDRSADAVSFQGPSSPSVSSTGCENCREQHLKCDRVTPVCGRCQASGRQCRRAGLKIRIAKRAFNKKQKWIKTPRRLVFIDETNEVTREAQHLDGGYDVEVDFESHWSSGESEKQDSLPSAREEVRQILSPTLPVAPASPTDRFILHEDAASGQQRQDVTHRPSRQTEAEVKSPNPELDKLREGLYLPSPVWPLSDPHEAFLLRNFVQNIAIWLDLCDPQRSFETIVPQRAATCPILLNAIFALSARYLSNTNRESDPDLKGRYHDEAQKYHSLCLNSLIPVLGHRNAVISDESLFAATIILRVLEEMEVRNRGQDIRGYLLGIRAFANAGNHALVPGTLGAASFAVGLRQEIYSAMMLKSRVENVDLNHAHIDRSLSEADEYTWANRAVVHCADVLNYCFAAGGVGFTHHRWEELSRWNRAWVEQRPASFLPIFCNLAGAGGPPFAEIWHHNSCHVIGIQHHILAELFLLRFGPQGFRADDLSSTARILDQTRIVVGIGLGNQWTPPGMFTACMAIAAFGDLFRDRRDQEAMLEILRKTERDHARPTAAVQSQMMRSWGRPPQVSALNAGQA